VKSGGGGFNAELERVSELRRGRLLGLSIARWEGDTAAMVRHRVRGGARPAR
jgi:hypothetical protein